MPGKRITDLTALSGAGSANNDDLVIFDATASETKRISRSQLAEGMQADVQVLSNKTLALGSNTVTGTTAQFNTALTDNNFATQAGAETLTNKTISGGTIDATSLSIGGTAVTSTAAELNILDGVTATTAELNILDGVTATTAELNILDGVTATTAELNILDGVTATTAELNILDGVTATTAELNILDGVTATAAELNVLDGVTGMASQAQAEAGTDNTVLMTPLRSAQAIAALTPAPTTAQILAANAGASVGAVGTYAYLLLNTNTDTDYAAGSTLAATNLVYAGTSSNTGGTTVNTAYSGTPSGTWRAMGYVQNISNSGGAAAQRQGATLWLRIS